MNKETIKDTYKTAYTGLEIAVIGMSGRFPAARDIDEFWDNLKNGVESIFFSTQEELQGYQGESGLIKDPDFVKVRGGILQDIGRFDAGFFGYTPAEAEIMPPQVRIFHECAVEALENAGYDWEAYNRAIGVYAGASSSSHWESMAALAAGKQGFVAGTGVDSFASSLLTNKDMLSTYISYKLNLTGPSFTVQTACSTSLLAIHLACQGLLAGECDMALAGGIKVSPRLEPGYLYQEGMVKSPDGHCRSFDAKAKGTVFGDGVGIVVLKRLEEAAADRDFIYAVIKGSAINNDGSRKVGYTAPSVDAQAAVIKAARHMAEVDPQTITYIEAHGTATPLGDPIEIEALKLAFDTHKKNFCAVGSVKTNIGHLDTAAGVAGFIKTVLALKYGVIPPSLHFETPHPKIDFENSPFYIASTLSRWYPGKFPRRAGVSAFGIGGTNVHVILEEPPGTSEPGGQYASQSPGGIDPVIGSTFSRPYHLILLSAKTETALETKTNHLIEYLKKNPQVDIGEVAYTLQVGRRPYKYRRMMVCTNVREAVNILSSRNSRQVHTQFSDVDKPSVVFMFPGQGSQYTDMGLELYRDETGFAEEIDHCARILQPIMGEDIRSFIFTGEEPDDPRGRMVPQAVVQPVLFVFEYALARLLMKWGITPRAMMGYSIGEYVAACLSGVFQLDQVLELIALRGKRMDELPPGAMLSVPLSENQLKPFLNLNKDLSLAVDNGSSCIAAGSREAITRLESQLKKECYLCTRLNISHAGHSTMIDPMLHRFEQDVRRVTLKPAKIPYISGSTGTWATAGETVEPGYWVRQVRETVRFARGLAELMKLDHPVFLEVGPGGNLSALARYQAEEKGEPEPPTLTLVRHPKIKIPDIYLLLTKTGYLWLYGKTIDWSGFHYGAKRNRLPLPAYPFAGQRFRESIDDFKMDGPTSTLLSQRFPGGKKNDVGDWFYIPSWKHSIPPLPVSADKSKPINYLVLIEDCTAASFASRLVKRLQEQHVVITVKTGKGYVKVNDNEYLVHPGTSENYHTLFRELESIGRLPNQILHLWCLSGSSAEEPEPAVRDKFQELGFYSLLYIAKALEQCSMNQEVRITAAGENLVDVTGSEPLSPAKATVLGPVKVIPQEYPHLRCQCIDIKLPGPGTWEEERLGQQLLAECTAPLLEPLVAYRGSRRLVQTFEPVHLAETGGTVSPLKTGGVYLVTGGMGGVGLILAQYLARGVQAKLILTGRSPFPPREQWEQWLETHPAQDPISQKILKIKNMEELGGRVLVFSVDIADYTGMQEVLSQAGEQFGPLNGVIHSAGVTRGKSLPCPIGKITREDCQEQFQSKVYGILVLEKLLQGRKLDFCLLMSSISTVLGGLGFAAYSAANLFMDALAQYHNKSNPVQWLSVQWDGWKHREKENENPTALLGANIGTLAMTPGEGIEAFQRVLTRGTANQLARLVHSTGDLQARVDQWVKLQSIKDKVSPTNKAAFSAFPSRPRVSTAYMAPQTLIQETIAGIWKEILGYRQVGTADDFFELGGDSLKAVTVVSRIHRVLNVKIPVSEIFKNPTISGLAQYVQDTRKIQYTSIPPVEKKEYYQLSAAQTRLYILQQMKPGDTAYNESAVMRLLGDIDRVKPGKILSTLKNRHESLRTSFQLMEGKPVQKVHDTMELEIEYHDLYRTQVEVKVEEKRQRTEDRRQETEDRRQETEDSGQTTENRSGTHLSSVIRHLSSGFIRPFDLSSAPLMRVGLFKLPHTPAALRSHPSQVGIEHKHILVVDMHHIITDGVSIDTIVKEFMALCQGENPAPLRVQYKDYGQWQNLEKESIKKQKEFWLKQFEEPVPPLDLPIDFPRLKGQDFEGTGLRFTIEKDKTEKLKQLALREEVTLFMVLLAIYNILLSKLSGQEDVVVGTAVAGRNHAELQPIVGIFVNTLALRNFPGGELTCKDFLKEVKQKALEAFENQDYQFEDLVEQLNLYRDTGRNPLFDTVLVLQNVNIPEITIPGLKLQPCEFESRKSKFDISWVAKETGSGLVFYLKYRTKLFKKETIERFVIYFKNIISAVLESVEKKLSAVEIVSAEEKELILHRFNNNRAAYPPDKGIHRLFARQVNRAPDHTALVGKEEAWKGRWVQITYKQLDEKSNLVAGLLIKKGVKPDTLVAIMMEPSVEMIIGILGILKAGGAYLPIDPGYPQERIDFMLKDSSAKILVTSNDLSKKCEKLSIINCQLLMVNEKPVDFHLHLSPAPVTCLAYIIYTSGTTGNPKGVLVEHKNVVQLLVNDGFPFDFNETDVWTLFHSYSFDFSVWEMWGALLYGSRLVIIPKIAARDTVCFLDILKKEKVTVLNQTPSAFDYLMTEELKGRGTRLNLRYVIFGGEALKPGKLKEWKNNYPALKLINMFGITETTVHVTFKEICAADMEAGISNIGKPLPTLSVYIMDRHLKLTPVGVAGECWVGGEGVARGYLNRPSLTKGKFPDNPYNPGELLYRSGDLARWQDNGEIEYLGRIDHQVKIRGYRIEPGEIEHQLLKHHRIKESLVTTRPDKNGEPYLCCYWVSDQNRCPEEGAPGKSGELAASELREYLSNVFPGYMIPAHFVPLDRIPLTPNGKVDWPALPGPAYQPARHYAAPGNEIEKKLVKIWTGVLSQSAVPMSIGIDDNFFELGGHSLKAVQMLNQVNKEFNVKSSLEEVFIHPTIRKLGQSIRALPRDKYDSIRAIEKKQYYSLSSAQKRLYILQQFEPGSISYNLPMVFILEGRLPVDKPERTFQKIIERHESLRTAICTAGEEPVQKVHDKVKFSIEYHQSKIFTEVSRTSGAPMSGAPGCAPQDPRPPEAIIKNFIRPFDLGRAPLLRVGITGLENEKHLLVADMHHIIADAVSMEIIVKDLTSLHKTLQLPALRLHYKDYAEWQNSKKVKKTRKKQENYWKQVFKGNIPRLNLPTDFSRPALQCFDGNSIKFEIGKVESGKLKALALKENTTLYPVLFTLFDLLLAKISGSEDIVVGTPIAGRSHAELHQIPGMFVNTLPLRNYPAADKRVIDLLREVKTRTLQAFENQDYPFEDLLDQLQLDRDPSRNSLFDVFFSIQNVEIAVMDTPGLKWTPYPFNHGVSKFDLSLDGFETGETLSFIFTYCTKLFSKGTIERLAGYFRQIVSCTLKEPGQKLSEVEIVPVQEKHRLLYEFNNSKEKEPAGLTVIDIFQEQTGKTPDKAALVGIKLCTPAKEGRAGEWVHLTYKELNKNAASLAHVLRQGGVKPGAIVGIMAPRSIEMITGLLGILKAGSAYLPIDPDYPEERIQYMLKDSGVEVLVTTQKLQVKVKAEVEENFGQVPELSLQLINIETELASAFEPPLSTLTSTSTCQVSPANLAYIIYTSGSTGKPRGVLVEHGNVVRLAQAPGYIDIEPGDRLLLTGAMVFDITTFEIWTPLLAGITLYLAGENIILDAGKLARILVKNNITLLHLIPQLFTQLAAQNIEMFAGLRCLMVGGDVVSPQTVNQLRNKYQAINILHMYGPTENTTFTTWYWVDKDYEINIPIGKPIDNTAVYVVDGFGHLAAAGVLGELWAGGKGVARGYLNQPELTVEKFTTNPFVPGERVYKTGDYARWLSNGTLEFQGRMDRQLKIRGFRIEPGEVENQLLKHPGIKEAVVILPDRANTPGHEYLCAYIVPGDTWAAAGELKEYLLTKLPAYMVPRFFVTLEQLPLTATGKIDRKALEAYETRAAPAAAYVAPVSEMEKSIANIWKEVLRLDQVGIHDHLFDIGGNSLTVIQINGKLKQVFKVDVPVTILFEHPTIHSLARYLRQEGEDRDIPGLEEKRVEEISEGKTRLMQRMQRRGETLDDQR